jgi:hypothetical protein
MELKSVHCVGPHTQHFLSEVEIHVYVNYLQACQDYIQVTCYIKLKTENMKYMKKSMTTVCANKSDLLAQFCKTSLFRTKLQMWV